jgi:hypothetical protein
MLDNQQHARKNSNRGESSHRGHVMTVDTPLPQLLAKSHRRETDKVAEKHGGAAIQTLLT